MRFKLGDKIFDSWWPWDIGWITKVTKSSVHIHYPDGEEQIYDRAHWKFLRKLEE